MGTIAQKNLFSEAIKQGPDANGIYHIKNPKGKDVSLENTASYIKKMGYIPLYGDDIGIVRWGDVGVVLDYFDFTDSRHYDTYAFWALSNKAGQTLNDLKGSGSFFLPKEEFVYEKTSISFISIARGTAQKLYRYDHALWSGRITDGLLDGYGTGFIISGDNYVLFTGGFDYGIPISSIYLKRGRKVNGPVESYSSESYDAVSTRVCMQNIDTNDQLLLKALLARSHKMYDENVKRVEDAYQKALKLNMSNYQQFERDNAIREFIYLYDHANTKYDPKNIMPKAKEVLKVYQVVSSLNMKIRDQYYGVNFWSLLSSNYEWFIKFVTADREHIQLGLDQAKWGKVNSNYGFKSFFSNAYQSLEKKMADFNRKVDSDRAEFQKKYNEVAKSNKRAYDEHERWKREHGHEIDWDNSNEPYGDLVHPLFLDSDWKFLNEGKIKMKSGNTYSYNINFDSDMSIKYYEADGPRMGYDRFKTKEDMLKAIVKAEKR